MPDIVDIDKLGSGNVSIVHSAITASVAEAACAKIDCRGKNALWVDVDISGGANNWTFKVMVSPTQHGTYKDFYQMNAAGTWTQVTYQFNSSRAFLAVGVSGWAKLVPTEDVNGSTVTVTVQPIII